MCDKITTKYNFVTFLGFHAGSWHSCSGSNFVMNNERLEKNEIDICPFTTNLKT